MGFFQKLLGGKEGGGKMADLLQTLITDLNLDANQVAKMKEAFQSFKQQARLGIIVNDIHRHPLAYYSIKWLTGLFSKSAMVKFDAPLSVLRAFTRKELEQILLKAEIEHYELSWKWAFRWQLVIINN